MAIRDIVTRGFGNETYDPGVNDLPVRGFSIGAAAATVTHEDDSWSSSRSACWSTSGRNMSWKSENNPVTGSADR